MKVSKYASRYATFFFLLGLINGPEAIPAHAEFSFQLKPQTIPPEQLGSVQALLSAVSNSLPAKIKSTLTEPVIVRFLNLNPNTPAESPLEVACSDQKVPPFTSGQVHRTLSGHWDLEINSRFLPEIAKGREQSRKFPCEHHNYYDLARATLLHEVAHIYDAKTHLSSGGQFHDLTGWRSNGFGPIQKNTLTQRSPDAYEFQDPQEAFAVNMEYFLMDPEFACRKPALFQYYSQKLGVPAPARTTCRKNSTILLESDDGRREVKIDPRRVYEVDYLLASPGTEPMSRFGHAMLRLAICAPERKTVGPECLKDVKYHVVLSYRANLDDLTTSLKKGLTGKYPSRLFAIPFENVVNDYNTMKLRDLRVVPLALSDEQKSMLIDQIVSLFWDYQGRYVFITNNCATETSSLIGAVVDDANPYRNQSSTTPTQLLNRIQTSHLEKDTVPADPMQQISEGYFFPSTHKQDVQTAFATIRTFLPGQYQNLNDYLENSSAPERIALFRKAKQEGAFNQRVDRVASFALLETQIATIESQKLNKKYAELAEDPKNNQSAQAKALFKKSVDTAKLALPWNLIKPNAGYGVPLKKEISPCLKMMQEKQTDEVQREIEELLPALFPEVEKEFREISNNVSEMSKEISLTSTEPAAPTSPATAQAPPGVSAERRAEVPPASSEGV